MVGDLITGTGPLGGIHTGLKEMSSVAGLVVACDMPRLDSGVLRKQCDMWCTADGDALVPLVAGRPEPLHAVYGKQCLPAIEEQIKRGEYRVRALFEAVRVRFWEPDSAEARTFANVNTPADWAQVIGTGGDQQC